MYVTVTKIELRSPWKFFPLSLNALKIIFQLRKDKACIKYKTKGFWTTHYTMSLWKSEEDLKTFARSGAHLYAMKQSSRIAKKIITLSFPGTELPGWSEAREKIEQGKILNF